MIKLPTYIIQSLKENKTSLGDQPCFPPEEEEKFIVSNVIKTFEQLSEKINVNSLDELKAKLSSFINEGKKIERNNISALENLCSEIINDFFQIPQDSIQLSLNIVDKVARNSERLTPEKMNEFSFVDIDEMNTLSSEIYKRRMLNALVSGASMYYTNHIGKYLQEIFELDSDLPSLYKKILDYSNVLMFCEKDSLNEEKANNGGKVEVVISTDDKQPIIKSEAVLFPILLEETIKGILELAIAHGLPHNKEKAKYVIGKADFRLAEMWDARLGYCLWKIIEDEAKECNYNLSEIGVNFFLMSLSELECEDFNKNLREIFGKTKKGKAILMDLIEEILYEKEKDDFDKFVETKNQTIEEVSDDDYFTSEELLKDNGILSEATKALISPQEAEKQGFAIPKEHLTWKEGEFQQPIKKEVGYKVFALINGKLYPPVVANKDGQDTPIGKWLPCSCPPIIGYTASEHRPLVKTGGKGTARNLGNLSFRPGWHLGLTPFASQFCYQLNASEKLMIDGRYVFPDNFVFAECEYQSDKDLSDECYKNGLTKNGKYQHSRAGIPRIPKNAFYRYRTNVDPSTADWIITGAIKVNKVLSREEVDSLNAKNGIKPLIYANKTQAAELKKQLLQQANNKNKEGNSKKDEDNIE